MGLICLEYRIEAPDDVNGLNIVFLWPTGKYPCGRNLQGRWSWNSQSPNAEGTENLGTRASSSVRRHRYASRRFGQSAFASSSGGGRASSLCLTSRSIASSAHAIS